MGNEVDEKGEGGGGGEGAKKSQFSPSPPSRISEFFINSAWESALDPLRPLGLFSNRKTLDRNLGTIEEEHRQFIRIILLTETLQQMLNQESSSGH